MVAGELVDKSTTRRTVVLVRYCKSVLGLICFYRGMCCRSPYHRKLPIDRRHGMDSGLIMGLSEQFGCIRDCRGPSWQMTEHRCLSSRRNPCPMDYCRHCDPNATWLITQSWDELLERIVCLAEADLGHPVTRWGRCERIGLSHSHIRLSLFPMPMTASLQQHGQGAEASELTPSMVSRIAIGVESTGKTTRAGRDHYLAYIPRTSCPET